MPTNNDKGQELETITGAEILRNLQRRPSSPANLTEGQRERLRDLVAMGPLSEKDPDVDLARAGLAYEYDKGCFDATRAGIQRITNGCIAHLVVYVDSKGNNLTDDRADLLLQLLPAGSELIRHDENSAEGGTARARAAAIELAKIVAEHGPGAFSLVVSVTIEGLQAVLTTEMGGR